MVEHPPQSGKHRARAAGWLLGSGVGQALLAFGANLVLVRAIAPAEFGRFALAYAGAGLVLSLCSLRLGAQIVRAPAGAALDRRLMGSALALESIAAGTAAALVLACTSGLELWTLCLVLASSAKHLAGQARGFLERDGRWTQLARMESAAQLGSHLVAVVLALSGFGLWALVLRELVLGVLWLLSLHLAGALGALSLRPPTPKEWRGLLQSGRDLWLDGVLEGLFARALILVSGGIGGERGAGLFAQALRLASVPHQLLAPLVSRLAFAWFAESADPGALRRRLAKRLAAPLVLAAALTQSLADPLVPWLFGAPWSDSAPLLSALWAYVLSISLLELCKMEFQALRDQRGLLFLRLVQFGALPMPLLAGSGPSALVHLCHWLSAATFLALTLCWWRLGRPSHPVAAKPMDHRPPSRTPKQRAA